MVTQNAETIFETDIFRDVIHHIQDYTNTSYAPYTKGEATMNEQEKTITKSYRIISDHLRAAIFLLSDGITSSNE
jgi:alanyl-tRNA synthetase